MQGLPPSVYIGHKWAGLSHTLNKHAISIPGHFSARNYWATKVARRGQSVNTVIVKGEVLGKVAHWKKEYQARGALHYHVLLWIDAPVIGLDDPDKVLAWIQERITCHLPNKESDPDLHRLVTRYQTHKLIVC